MTRSEGTFSDKPRRLLLVGVVAVWGLTPPYDPPTDSPLVKASFLQVGQFEPVFPRKSVEHDELTDPLCAFAGSASIKCTSERVLLKPRYRTVPPSASVSVSYEPGRISLLGPRGPPRN